MPGGRPSTYTPEACAAIEAALEEGLSLTAAAGEIGVCRDTVYAWRDEYPEFSDAIKRGKAAGQAVWERGLLRLGRTGIGNATAHVFAMKNIYHEDWKDRVDHAVGDGEGGPVGLKIVREVIHMTKDGKSI